MQPDTAVRGQLDGREIYLSPQNSRPLFHSVGLFLVDLCADRHVLQPLCVSEALRPVLPNGVIVDGVLPLPF